MKVNAHGLSDIGLRRQVNEDSFLVDDELRFFVVADGVGGQAKGEVASAEAVEAVHGFVRQGRKTIESLALTPSKENVFAVRRLVESAVQSACYMVYGMAELDPERKGMSTTMSALLITDHFGVVAQVGDSRVYRVRDDTVKTLTEDHTLVNYKLKTGQITPEQAVNEPGKNVITRAVGHRDYVQVDTLLCEVRQGDRFMLCSDGLHGYADEQKMIVLLRAIDEPIEIVSKKLIDLANAGGGKDNITAIVIDVS